jgi:hypothetical protein
MEVNTGTPAKRSRAKPKTTAKAEAKPTVVVKKSRAPKKVTVSPVSATTVPAANSAVIAGPGVDELQAMIAVAAYYLAAERHFSPGQELDDWLEAERRVLALYR